MKTTLLSILLLTLISCDASSKEFIGTSWKVTDLNNKGKSVAVTNDVILTIKSDTEFTLKLDKNNCFGTYAITEKNTIKLSALGCTEMCCDSDFSMAVTSALYEVSTINLKKDKVTLSGDNTQIKFEKYEIEKSRIKMMNTDENVFIKPEKIPTPETTDVGRFEKPTTTEGSVNTTKPKGDFITLYKSPCKGTCEEFTMLIYEDGTVIYTGKHNAKVQGKHMVKLAGSKSKSLFKEFEQADFKSFEAKYDNERIMDLQNTYLTYKGKKIHIRYKNAAPKKLRVLLEKVENQANEALEKLKKK